MPFSPDAVCDKHASNMLPSFAQTLHSKPPQINENGKMTNYDGQHGHTSTNMDSPNNQVPLLPAINRMPVILIPVLDGTPNVSGKMLQPGSPSVHHRPGGLTETIQELDCETNADDEDYNDHVPFGQN